ncbi:MAG: GNVR domain-containing protein, partial [Bacteroidales bacterium]|nr:GNVR domain-containing protein [Bacteroidales bacterium]
MIKNTAVIDQEDEIDLKKIINFLLRQWHWFLLFGTLGFVGAYIYYKFTKPLYSVSAYILVQEKSSGIDMKNLFSGTLDQSNNNIFNQIEIINSYYIINKTLLNLNWRTSWYKKDMLIWKGIYKQEPFDVQEAQNFVNPKGIAIYITPNSDDVYTVSVNGKLRYNNVITDVKFEEKGTFDLPFVNKYFNFTLLKKVNNYDTPDGQYYFVFNDLKDATLAYMNKVKASLKNPKTDIIQLLIEGEEPVKEGEFINELIKVYIESKINLQNEVQRRSLDFINGQLTGISDSLNAAGTKFTEFRSKNKIYDLGTEGTLVMNILKEIESEGAKSQMQLDYFQNLLKYLNNISDSKKIVSPSVVGIQDALLNSMVLKLSELYNRRQIISFSAKENNLTLGLIDKEIAQTRNSLIENLRNLIENASRSINSQKNRQASISSQLNKLPQKEQQMINIQRKFDLANEIYTFLLQKRAETNIAMASTMPDVQIIDIARPETATIIGLPQLMILIIGIILGLVLPLGFILIINFFNDRIDTQECIEDKTNLPILGNIFHDQTKSDLCVYENPKSNIAESFRGMRTNLQFMLTEPQGKIISIHSIIPLEGKSFISINLATILAMNNKNVLLIGTDMRKPKLHKVFNISNEIGLSTYL